MLSPKQFAILMAEKKKHGELVNSSAQSNHNLQLPLQNLSQGLPPLPIQQHSKSTLDLQHIIPTQIPTLKPKQPKFIKLFGSMKPKM